MTWAPSYFAVFKVVPHEGKTTMESAVKIATEALIESERLRSARAIKDKLGTIGKALEPDL